jgi:hypothetical protein
LLATRYNQRSHERRMQHSQAAHSYASQLR